jgi:hypothetical protein
MEMDKEHETDAEELDGDLAIDDETADKVTGGKAASHTFRREGGDAKRGPDSVRGPGN